MMSKSSKRRQTKKKLPDKASMEERKSIAHSALEYFLRLFLRLWEIGRNRFRSGSLERPSFTPVQDAASSSSALGAPSEMSVAAEHASEEQTEGLAGKAISFGTFNDKDPCDYPNWTGHSNEVSTLDPEVLEAEFSRGNGFMVGKEYCPYPDVCRRSNGEPAILPRVIEDDEIKHERSGSDTEYWEKRYHDAVENFNLNVELRQVVSNYEKKPEGKSTDAGLKKEVLKLPAAKNEKMDMILDNASYMKILRTMFFQRANIDLKSEFEDTTWRTENRFQKFSNDDADYLWWKDNFNLEILQRRLEIFRVAAENWNPELDMFKILQIVSGFNSSVHPQPSKDELNEKDEVKMSRLKTRIYDLNSGGDSKIQ